MMDTHENLTIREKCCDLKKTKEILNCGTTFLYERLIKTGELVPIKIGKKNVFIESEIYKYIERKKAERTLKTGGAA